MTFVTLESKALHLSLAIPQNGSSINILMTDVDLIRCFCSDKMYSILPEVEI